MSSKHTLRLSSLDRRHKHGNNLFPVTHHKKFQVTQDDTSFFPELQRYKFQIKSYMNKRRQLWYDSLGPATEEIRHQHDNVNLLLDYETEEKIQEKQKILDHKMKVLKEKEINLNKLIGETSDTLIVKIIDEAEEKQRERENVQTKLRNLKETLSVLEKTIVKQRLILEEISNSKSFTLSILNDKKISTESVDFEQFFAQFDERLKLSLAENTFKSMQVQNLEKHLSAQRKHWIHDLDDLKSRRNYLLSQTVKEKNRLDWLKETLAKYLTNSP